MQIRMHDSPQTCRSGSSAAVDRTVGVTAPIGPVRGYLCSRPWPPKPAAHGRTADGGGRGRASNGVCAGQRRVARAERAGCKTVGSAYVGSNPTPATTCRNGPLAANSRLCRPFLFVPACVTFSRCRPTYASLPSADRMSPRLVSSPGGCASRERNGTTCFPPFITLIIAVLWTRWLPLAHLARLALVEVTIAAGMVLYFIRERRYGLAGSKEEFDSARARRIVTVGMWWLTLCTPLATGASWHMLVFAGCYLPALLALRPLERRIFTRPGLPSAAVSRTSASSGPAPARA